jgi:putative two-component system response regulator
MVDNRQTVLIVDDVPQNISILNEILNKFFIVKAATNGKKALEIANSENPPDIIILDVMMPEMSGYEVCEILKSQIHTRDIPVIFITALNDPNEEEKGLKLGAVDYIIKPLSPSVVLKRIQTHLELANQNAALENMVRERTRELEETRLAIIQRLGRAAEFKDNETGMHVIRMSNFSRITALANGLSEYEADLILHAAPMHDIGKIGIPDNILLKPGKLDEFEWQVMKKHPIIGAEIIGEHDSEIMKVARECAMYHHEKFDGTGYPTGIKGKDIPYYARIVAIVDVFDALTSERPYKKAWSLEEALQYITENKGKQFDPDITDSFLTTVDEIKKIQKNYPEIAETA